MFVVKLPKRGRRRPLQIQQVAAQPQPAGHLRKRALVCVKACSIEGAHGGEELRAGFDADAGLVAGAPVALRKEDSTPQDNRGR
jgi:hypothetical protein